MALRVLMLHGGSTSPCGDVTPWAKWQKGGVVAHGRVAKWQNCLRTELPEAKLLLGGHPTLGCTLGHGFIPIGCHVTSGYVLLCTPVLGRNV